MVLSNYPELPRLAGDDVGDLYHSIYSHRTTVPTGASQHPGFGDGDRLAELGAQVLRCAVTKYYFRHPEMLSSQTIRDNVGCIMLGPKIHEWLDYYDLKRHLKFGPELSRNEMLNNDREMSNYFCAYIGALFYCSGPVVVDNWIRELLNASSDGVKVEEEDVAMAGQEGSAPPLYTPPPPPPSLPPPAPSGTQGLTGPSASPSLPLAPEVMLVTRSKVHEAAMKATPRSHISYVETSEGPSHTPLWTIRCLVDNVERGRATAKSKNEGKDLAARYAYVAMGWHGVGRRN